MPHFVYGSLRPGELAHRHIQELIESSTDATVSGFTLMVRDGLPTMVKAPGKVVKGVLLWAHPTLQHDLNAAILAYEPDELYRGERVSVADDASGREAWAYVCRRSQQGRPVEIGHEWSSRDDPLFGPGLNAIRQATERHLREKSPIPANMPEFWEVFLPLQGNYLTLYTILERYTNFAYGPDLDPSERIAALKKDLAATEAVALADPPAFRVRSAHEDRNYRVPGPGSFAAWYQVRNNLSHRGKAAFDDFDLLERSLVGLHDTLALLLDSQLPRRTAATSARSDGPRLLRSCFEQERRSKPLT